MRKILAASVLALVSGTPRAQVPAGEAVPLGIRFHHVHLNSVNPAAAAAYYPKAFTTSVQTTFNGYEAIRTVNGPYLLFSKVNTPPPTQPQSAIWHFGWNTPDSRAYLERFHALKLDVAPMYAGPDNAVVEISSDVPGDLPDDGPPHGAAGPGRAAPACRRVSVSARAGRRAGRERRQLPADGVFQPRAPVPRGSRVRPAVVHDHGSASAPRVQGRGAPITADNCKRPYEEVTWPAFDKIGMVRNPAGAVPVSDMVSILIRPRHGPYVSPRGQIVDHFALSVPDLDGLVARLKREGVKVTEEIHRWGAMRAAMIEGPDLVAIELVSQ